MKKKEVCSFVKESGLLLIKDEFTDNCDAKGEVCLNVSPLSKKLLKIYVGDEKVKEISYLSHYYNQEDPQLEVFKIITTIIEDFISKKVEELEIYEPVCGYM